jgi:hypothetical protein
MTDVLNAKIVEARPGNGKDRSLLIFRCPRCGVRVRRTGGRRMDARDLTDATYVTCKGRTCRTLWLLHGATSDAVQVSAHDDHLDPVPTPIQENPVPADPITEHLTLAVKAADERLAAIAPIVDEYHRLSARRDELASLIRLPRRQPQPRASRPSMVKRGRPRGGGRYDEALRLVQMYPGITIREIGERMGIRHNYLYRVLPALADDGKVRRVGHGWMPVASGNGKRGLSFAEMLAEVGV